MDCQSFNRKESEVTQDNGTSDVRILARAQGVESGVVDGLGVALCSPVSPSAAEPLRGAQRGAEHVSDAQAAPILAARGDDA